MALVNKHGKTVAISKQFKEEEELEAYMVLG